MMANLAEVLVAQAEQCGSVEFRIAADVVVRMRMQRLALAIAPHFLRVIPRLDVDRARTPVVLLAAHVVAALEQQDALPRRRQMVGQRSAAGAGADDDHVVMRHMCSRVCVVTGDWFWLTTKAASPQARSSRRSEERRVGKECRSRWS